MLTVLPANLIRKGHAMTTITSMRWENSQRQKYCRNNLQLRSRVIKALRKFLLLITRTKWSKWVQNSTRLSYLRLAEAVFQAVDSLTKIQLRSSSKSNQNLYNLQLKLVTFKQPVQRSQRIQSTNKKTKIQKIKFKIKKFMTK